LELRYAELLQLIQARPRRDVWCIVVGMFADDPQIEDLHRETQRIREEDRMGAKGDADHFDTT
jgi:hypothetical protein